jgi:hypothetical protein
MQPSISPSGPCAGQPSESCVPYPHTSFASGGPEHPKGKIGEFGCGEAGRERIGNGGEIFLMISALVDLFLLAGQKGDKELYWPH